MRPGGLALAFGAAAGVLAAALGLLQPWPSGLDSLSVNAVGRVNGEIIRREDYERVLAAVAQDRRAGLDEAQRRHVLERLIDEELLVQRGLALGMARHDAKVRKDLTAAVIDAVVSESGDVQPNEGELQAFYQQNRELFTGPGRLRVRQIFCRAPGTSDAAAVWERAQQAAQRLRAGDDFSALRAALGDEELAPLPDGLLPPAKLVDYLGPTAAHTAAALAPGAVSDPVRSSTGYHVLQVIERQPDPDPPLDEIRPQVLAEFRRRAGERALRDYLDELRARADIEIATSLP
ncbi:MAG: peptidyl-prolyl cis-trans isomerase [Deltaproteobacteria bacterium]|nr:peptidyl-prolyl cis-trans isomerase [Deltaproteobacteria bacterium]